MKRISYVIIGLLAILIAGGITIIANDDVRLYLKLHIYHKDYLNWKYNGGPWKDDYFDPLMHDRYRDEVILGKKIDDILLRYPYLTDGDSYPAGYKASYTYSMQRNKLESKIKVYWLRPQDGFDWAFVFEDGIGKSVNLVKG